MFEIYGCDTETTHTSPIDGEPIEITLYKLSTDECKTWWLKPININNIQADALKINGHNLNDLLHKTAEGKAKYRKPEDVIIEIENWLMEDGMATEQRVLLGHNVSFDRDMLEWLWKKCNSSNTYPLNQKYSICTMQTQFSIDYANGVFGEGYSLRNLAKLYKVKQEKAHTSEDDTKVMVQIYREQLKLLKGALPKSE